MSTIRPATELDFDQIKDDIIVFIKTNPTFSDYNFTGSALNAIVDILAYNTHTNAYYANMLHNEGFIETAQKRSSVVSRAKELGYTPRSAACSVAFINVTVPANNPDELTYIERGTSFTSVNDTGLFNFSVTDTTASKLVDSFHTFSNIKIVNGVYTKNIFSVDTFSNIRSIFTIPNDFIDTSTLRVFVRNSIASIEKEEYFLAKNVYELKSDSKVYFLQESYDGFFQIYFGNDVIGSQPIDLNVIDVDYFVTQNTKDADGCRLFGFDGTIASSSSINIETTQVSFGGAGKEKIESIKFNAIKSNSAKSRSVTSSDYILMLKEKFDFIKTASVWGGEDNLPPVYGKVFVSIQPVSGYTISDSIKRDVITPVIRSNSLMTIGIEYVDPTYVDLNFDTKIKYNSSKSNSNKSEIAGLVKNNITNYINSISTFNKDYLESTLISSIMKLDTGIMSVSIKKRVGFRLSPLINVESKHVKNINNEIKVGSILSNQFTVIVEGQEVIVTIQEVPNSYYIAQNLDRSYSNNTILGIFNTDNLLIKKIGNVDLNHGKFNITFNVYSYHNLNRFIYIQFNTVVDDIITMQNQILQLANSTDTLIGNNNVVSVENYGK